MNSHNTLLEVRNIDVTFKSRRAFFKHDYFKALRNVSFDVFRGETLGVIGTNGCGKSTLLKILAGIYKADGGHVNWHCKQASLLSLALGFDPNLSGHDNAILSGMLLGIRKTEVMKKLGEITEFAEMEKFIENPVKTYSAGMRARLGFAVALKMRSELLLIDEVLGVGDGRFQKKAAKAMVEKIKSDQTVVLVSHSTSQLRELCDRVVWLDKGMVRKIGTPDHILPRYQAFLDK